MTFLKIRRVVRSLNSLFSSKPVTEKEVSLLSDITKENQYEILSNVVTPLWKVDYCEQILMKKKWSQGFVNKIKSKHLPKAYTKLYEVIPSGQIYQYRNKDEFNINTGIDGNPKTVGLFVGSGHKGNIVCVPPTYLQHIKSKHIEIAKIFQDFLQTSPLKACLQLDDGGFWRNILIRSNRNGDLLCSICAHPRGIPEDGNIEDIKSNLVQYFQLNAPAVKSLYLQICPHTICTPEQAPYTLLYGDSYITEFISNYVIRITPNSFVHTNIESVQLLNECILNFLNLDSSYTVLDLNCGIGALSLCASSSVRGCIGLDNSSSSIEDATFNAKRNNINNCNFILGNIKMKLRDILNELNSVPNIVAVVTVGKQGINKEAIKILRRCVQLKRLVYVASSADSPETMSNIIGLCQPKFDLSGSFYLTHVQPIDNNPHTKYCDLIMIFERQ